MSRIRHRVVLLHRELGEHRCDVEWPAERGSGGATAACIFMTGAKSAIVLSLED
uniref:Uncharacterized protein n=1 Tax=Oryza sativa subsp. japonica TaxID=39947 RepID=Q8H4C6_ORYSJ|nr:hypothetical protein [Oryza sativa Japonica Group]BAD31305.1 hypothetical protein [Oryza sativa Japonica Group]